MHVRVALSQVLAHEKRCLLRVVAAQDQESFAGDEPAKLFEPELRSRDGDGGELVCLFDLRLRLAFGRFECRGVRLQRLRVLLCVLFARAKVTRGVGVRREREFHFHLGRGARHSLVVVLPLLVVEQIGEHERDAPAGEIHRVDEPGNRVAHLRLLLHHACEVHPSHPVRESVVYGLDRPVHVLEVVFDQARLALLSFRLALESFGSLSLVQLCALKLAQSGRLLLLALYIDALRLHPREELVESEVEGGFAPRRLPCILSQRERAERLV
mmetsp:Transcript_30893/g.100567  ORF Transcript_30893/g.100567 Transcript_30893/m.100567 type:complete len:270 (-) Transcript_30893:24-833(-)